jgi:hypothetical protein
MLQHLQEVSLRILASVTAQLSHDFRVAEEVSCWGIDNSLCLLMGDGVYLWSLDKVLGGAKQTDTF